MGEEWTTEKFWKENYLADQRAPSHTVAIVDGHHYRIYPDREYSYGSVGFGGREFRIQFFDGYEVVTHNLWHQGEIPVEFRYLMPDNAVFIPKHKWEELGGIWYLKGPRFTKDFDLSPGDRVRIIMSAQEPFPAGWADGTIISARFYGGEEGWYIEFDKDNVSPGWQTGYGYWKQGIDGGTIMKL